MKITEIINELISLHNKANEVTADDALENIIFYSHYLGKLEGVCELLDLDMNKIMKKAGLDVNQA